MSTLKQVQLPADGHAHHTAIEWWYFNGQLAATGARGVGSGAGTGRRYAFMNSLFRADPGKALIPSLKSPIPNAPYAYFAHALLSDLGAQKTYKAIDPVCIVSRDSFSRPLLFANYVNPLALAHGYENNEIAETAPGNFHVKTELFDLELAAQKKPLFEGGTGRITVCGKQSYYYSYTDLAARGFVKAGDAWVPVAGKAWMDHQWANVSWSTDKWSWFSFQFDNGIEVMCVEYDDGRRKDYLVDVMDARGRAGHYARMHLTPRGDIWESMETGARYPLAWSIEIPDKKMVLTVRSLLRDQEMVSGPIHYWEGPVEVSGTMKGKALHGRGFMELVGYPGRGGRAQGARTLWQRIGFGK